DELYSVVPVLCSPGPRMDCAPTLTPLKSPLVIKKKTPSTSNSVSWQWAHGPEILAAQFGDPLATDDYALCLYDGTPTLVSELRAPHGDTGNGKQCWKGKGTPIGSKGWIYADKGLTPTGLSKVVLKPGLVEKGKLTGKAKADALIIAT